MTTNDISTDYERNCIPFVKSSIVTAERCADGCRVGSVGIEKGRRVSFWIVSMYSQTSVFEHNPFQKAARKVICSKSENNYSP